jgi:hypothetical protein
VSANARALSIELRICRFMAGIFALNDVRGNRACYRVAGIKGLT